MTKYRQQQETELDIQPIISIQRSRFWMSGCLALGMIAVLAVGIILYKQSVSIMAARDSVIHRNLVLAQLENALSTMKDAETGQRGFLLTGNDAYLEPYTSALASVDARLDELRRMTVDDAYQQDLLHHLGPAIKGKLAELQLTVGLRRTKGLDAAVLIVKNDSGKKFMSEIRSDFEAMKMHVRQQVIEATRQLQSSTRTFVITFAWLAVLAIGLFCAFGYFMSRYMKAITASQHSRQILQEKLVERSQFLEEQASLLELSHDAILVRDMDGTIRYWNHGAQDIYGFTKEDAVGQKSHQLLQTRFPVQLEEIEKEAVTFGRWEGELIHLTRDNRSVTVASRWRLTDATEGYLSSILETNTDITERRRAEEALLLAQVQKVIELERSNEELQQFAYVCSHDLQEPLRVISNFSQLLANRYRGRLDEKADQFIEFIVDGSKRMQNLINDLLIYSRVQTNSQALGEVDCSKALEMAIANLKLAIEETGAIINHGTLPTIKGDASQLLQLFQNLLANAIKFRSKEPPNIHISADKQGDIWQFALSDNGLGIDMQFADRIFVIFQRLHPKDEYPGSGIGLAVCKKIVQRHGGRLWVESGPGKGTTFYFTVPVITEEEKT